MLEQVRESSVTRPLIFRSDVIPKIDRNDRTRVILVQEYIEAVVERVFGERDFQLRKLPQVGIALP